MIPTLALAFSPPLTDAVISHWQNSQMLYQHMHQRRRLERFTCRCRCRCRCRRTRISWPGSARTRKDMAMIGQRRPATVKGTSGITLLNVTLMLCHATLGMVLALGRLRLSYVDVDRLYPGSGSACCVRNIGPMWNAPGVCQWTMD